MERLRLTGIDEGLTVVVSTIVSGADHPGLVMDAVKSVFPDFACQLPDAPIFPNESNEIMADNEVSLGLFLEKLNQQRILDTALDHMSKHMDEEGTIFHISRQAAITGKIAFPLVGDNSLGGVITIEIGGPNLKDWLEAATWHGGRDTIPRHVGDEYSMYKSGEASTWH
ncbi:MAG TPA: hypothetical protein EYQ73_03210 [Candidatus Poseidoniales archaeon]|jgi:predicted RNA binding protein with dsRBD fold (UPF0201 family)|nr:MAG: hypothetical protein CXT71_08180 [Euryarchaeota archaeon]HIF45788.1 hypothetical protein [Candidatus Poseidoniales archaeon]HIL65911.1 hypothetical protein [Candidatus Poseidoniales archaeon]